MKVTLPDGRLVKIGIQHGNEAPKLDRPIPAHLAGLPFRSVRCQITVFDGEKEVSTFSGVSYCNPGDQFKNFTGRSKAFSRALRQDPKHLLSKEDRKVIAAKLNFPQKVKEGT